MQKNERGLGEAAVGDDGLADQGRLAIEVIDAAAEKCEARVGLEFLAGVAFAVLGRLPDGELVFKRDQDHADWQLRPCP